jgi:phage shock protein C
MTERLYRSRRDRMLAGVAGGLAEMWDVDPSLVRIAWALLVIFTGGIALLVYIVMAIVVPEEGDATSASNQWPMPPPPPSAPGPATTSIASGSDAAAGEGVAGSAAPAPASMPAGAPGPASTWTPSYGARDEVRAARREARAGRRAAGGGHISAIIGIILVGLGIYFLARQWLPQIDFDWFWPLVLVGIGVILLVSAVTRRPDDPGGA